MENSSPPIKEAFEFEHNRCDLSASYYPVQISRPTNCGEALLLLRKLLLGELVCWHKTRKVCSTREASTEKAVSDERRTAPLLFLISVCLEFPSSSFAETSLTRGKLFSMEGGLTLRGEQSVARDQSICNAASRNRRESAEIRHRAAGSI